MNYEMLDIVVESMVSRLYRLLEDFEADRMTFESFRERSGELLAILSEMQNRSTQTDFEKLKKLENHVNELRGRVVNHWTRLEVGVPA